MKNEVLTSLPYLFEMSFLHFIITEAKRNFAAHFDLSVGITDLKRDMRRWSEMWLTFRNTTPAVNQEFDRKRWIETSTWRRVSESKICSITCFQATPFCCPMMQKFPQLITPKWTSSCHCLLLKKFICQSCLSLRIFFGAQCSRDLHSKQREMIKYEKQAVSDRVN